MDRVENSRGNVMINITIPRLRIAPKSKGKGKIRISEIRNRSGNWNLAQAPKEMMQGESGCWYPVELDRENRVSSIWVGWFKIVFQV